MSKPITPSDSQGTSTRPYLIRALHDWCTDNGFTPYVAVFVDNTVQVPMEYVKNNEIVLNVGFEATTALKLGNEFIEFKARFGGLAREIVVPVDHIVAIYARENGQGMAFPVPTASGTGLATDDASAASAAPLRGLRLARTETETESAARDAGPAGAAHTDEPPEPGGPASPRPSLKRIK
jgi:stringent starvation protein B